MRGIDGEVAIKMRLSPQAMREVALGYNVS